MGLICAAHCPKHFILSEVLSIQDVSLTFSKLYNACGLYATGKALIGRGS